jgi:ankyrin repeat protein
MCFFCCINSPLKANDDLLNLFHLAVENGDFKLVTEVIDALLKDKKNSNNLLDALVKYSENGKIDFALHNAINDRNLLASVILAHHAKNINTRKHGSDYVWIAQNSAVSRPSKTPIELSLEFDMIEMISYLLIKGADVYSLNDNVGFLNDYEENINYLTKFGCKAEKKVCVKSGKSFFLFPKENSFSFIYKRNFIGDAIAKNRIDVIEVLQKMSKVNWNTVCCTIRYTNYTPLQFALAIERYEIDQFLIDHGARIE